MRLARVTLLILLAGCGFPNAEQPGPKPQGGDREMPRNRPATSEGGWARKVVNDKEAPATLIAADRTSCIVPERKFRDTVIGSKIWCAWR